LKVIANLKSVATEIEPVHQNCPSSNEWDETRSVT